MAIVKGGIALGFSGKHGNTIFSQQKDGTTIARQVPVASQKPPTVKTLSTLGDTAICSGFLNPIKEFAQVGYELQCKIEKRNYYNSISSYVRLNAFTSVYPNRRIDFSKVLVTKGQMQLPEDATVTLTEFGLAFTWNTETEAKGIHYSDQVMMLAYFPELEKAKYMTAGAQRHQGKDLLVLNGIPHGHIAEIYISFISDNRKSISDSVYLGQLIW